VLYKIRKISLANLLPIGNTPPEVQKHIREIHRQLVEIATYIYKKLGISMLSKIRSFKLGQEEEPVFLELEQYLAQIEAKEKFSRERKNISEVAKFALEPEKREQLINIVARQAHTAPQTVGSKGYLTNLLNNTQLPDNWKIERSGALTGSPLNDASALIDWAIIQQINTRRGTHSVLAELIESLLDYVGKDDKDFLRRLVLDTPLILDSNAVTKFCARWPE
jgi:hypothetical protein